MKKNVRVMSLLAPLALAAATSAGAACPAWVSMAAMFNKDNKVDCTNYGSLQVLDFYGKTKAQFIDGLGPLASLIDAKDLAFIPDGVSINKVAYIDAQTDKCEGGTACELELKVSKDLDVQFVYVYRAFKKDVFSTLTLPFDLNTGDVKALNMVLEFNGVKQKEIDGEKKTVVSMKKVWEKGKTAKTLEAYKPYLIKMSDEAMNVSTEGVTIKKLPSSDIMSDKAPMWQDVNGWVFFGTLKGYQWTEEDEYYTQFKGISYGFAAEAAGSIVAGQFVKAGEGSWIGPFRAFLFEVSEIGADAGISTVRSSVGKTPSTFKLPEQMDVVIEDEDEQQTTTIGRLNTRTGEFLKAETRVFDLKGRNINGSAPRARGAYYGKKSVVR